MNLGEDTVIVVLTAPFPGRTCEATSLTWNEAGGIAWSEFCILPATHIFEKKFLCLDHTYAAAQTALQVGIGWPSRSGGNAAEGEAAAEGGESAGSGMRNPASPRHPLETPDKKEGE